MTRSTGALLLLVSFLCISAAIRGIIGASAAFANVVEPADAIVPEPESCPALDDPTSLIAAIAQRTEVLDQQEQALRQKRTSLLDLQEEIEAQLASLSKAEDELSQTLKLAEQGAESDLVQLVSVYEAMKPKQAAILFETMAPEFAAGFLARMAPDRAAGVLAGMTPESAYIVSAILAGRNALAPTE